MKAIYIISDVYIYIYIYIIWTLPTKIECKQGNRRSYRWIGFKDNPKESMYLHVFVPIEREGFRWLFSFAQIPWKDAGCSPLGDHQDRPCFKTHLADIWAVMWEKQCHKPPICDGFTTYLWWNWGWLIVFPTLLQFTLHFVTDFCLNTFNRFLEMCFCFFYLARTLWMIQSKALHLRNSGYPQHQYPKPDPSLT